MSPASPPMWIGWPPLLLSIAPSYASSAGCTVERVSVSGKDVRDILQEHREKDRPVILRNATDHWEARQAWSRDGFLRSYGGLSVRAERQNMYAGAHDSDFAGLRTLREFATGPSTGDIVLSFGDGQLLSALAKDISPMPEALRGVMAEPVFTLGRLNTGADFHNHDEVWVAQMHGRKAWLLSSMHAKGRLPRGGLPCDVYRAPLRLGDAVDMENCTVEPGEVIFLPDKWFHNTCNLDDFTLGVGGRGRSPAAHAACNMCDVDGLRRVVERDASAVVAVDRRQHQPIHACSASNCREGLRYLVSQGADPSAPVAGGREKGDRPLHFTFCNKPSLSSEAAQALLELGADHQALSERCGKILHSAAFFGDAKLVEILISAGADPAEQALGFTPLEVAEGRGHDEVARLLRDGLTRSGKGSSARESRRGEDL